METYKKIDNQLEITENDAKTSVITLDELNQRKTALEGEIGQFQEFLAVLNSRLDKINARISEAKKLGIK